MADTIAAIHPGMTEIEIQGVAGCEVLKRGAFPNLILVGSDERISRFRHPVPTQVALKRYCMVVICAQRWGLVSSVTRLVHFGPLPDELSRRYDALLEVEHAIVCATVPGNALSEIFEVARCAYSAAGFDGEEQKHFQGGTCGYYGREQELSPRIPYRIREGEVFAHNPSITGVKLEDTVHTSNGAFEILTEVPEWPVREITREGITLKRPEILIR
jgi:antitoxin VapB